MADFNSVPSASENMYGDQGKGDSGSQMSTSNRPAATGDPAVDDDNRSRMKRKGDREREEKEEEKKNEEKNKKNSPEGQLKEQVSNPQKLMKNIKNIQLFLKLARAAQKVQQIVATALRVTIAVAQAIIAIITAVIVAICAVLLSWLFGETTTTSTQPTYTEVAYVNRAATGRGGEEFELNASKREIARNIYSAMRMFKVADDPSGAKAQKKGGASADTDFVEDGAALEEGEPVQIAVGLRPERIFAMIGNFNHESGLDPTSVETIFDEPFMIGKDKAYFIQNDFVAELCANTTERKEYFEEFSTIHRVGVGLGAWTDVAEEGTDWSWTNPGRNYKLMQYAKLYSMENAMDPDASHPNWLDKEIDETGRPWSIPDNETESLW